MNRGFYFVILLCVALGVFFSVAGPHLGAWMADTVPSPTQQQKLQLYYQLSLSTALAIPAQPVPALMAHLVPFNLLSTVAWALFLVQIALLLRRVAICFRAKAIQAPTSLSHEWKLILWISLVLWLLGILGSLLPALVQGLIQPALGVELAKGLAYVSRVVGAFIVPYFWLIPSNFFAPSFFVIELMSLRKEGLLPLPDR